MGHGKQKGDSGQAWGWCWAPAVDHSCLWWGDTDTSCCSSTLASIRCSSLGSATARCPPRTAGTSLVPPTTPCTPPCPWMYRNSHRRRETAGSRIRWSLGFSSLDREQCSSNSDESFLPNIQQCCFCYLKKNSDGNWEVKDRMPFFSTYIMIKLTNYFMPPIFIFSCFHFNLKCSQTSNKA